MVRYAHAHAPSPNRPRQAYFALGGAMHDTAISVWSAKGWYDTSRPVSVIRWMCDNGQNSDPLQDSYDVNGIGLVPGRIEVVTVNSSAPGQRHAALSDCVGCIALWAWRGPTWTGDGIGLTNTKSQVSALIRRTPSLCACTPLTITRAARRSQL